MDKCIVESQASMSWAVQKARWTAVGYFMFRGHSEPLIMLNYIIKLSVERKRVTLISPELLTPCEGFTTQVLPSQTESISH